MMPPSLSLPPHCRILALSSSAAMEELLASFASAPGPTMETGEGPSAWDFTFLTWAPTAAALAGQERQAGEPFALAVIDSREPEEQLEAVVTALWEADRQLPILILRDRALALGDWHLPACQMRDQLALIRMPCETAELGQTMNLMAGKWLRERQIERLKRQLAVPPQEVNNAPGTAPLPAGKATHGTILVVDDDETIRLVVSQVLATTNHHILTAGNAEEAWQQWRRHRGAIKLVITDINMPGDNDGVALGQVVQQEDATVPVIYTSGYRAASQFPHLKDGINYLSKPFGMADLLKVVERNLTGI